MSVWRSFWGDLPPSPAPLGPPPVPVTNSGWMQLVREVEQFCVSRVPNGIDSSKKPNAELNVECSYFVERTERLIAVFEARDVPIDTEAIRDARSATLPSSYPRGPKSGTVPVLPFLSEFTTLTACSTLGIQPPPPSSFATSCPLE